MNTRKVVWMIGIIILALAVGLLLIKSCYITRGYWAVGGEIFVPMVIVGWGVYAMFNDEEKNNEK